MHRDFDADRRAADPERDPITFALGGQTFHVVHDPSLGDTLDLAEAPEFDPANLTGASSIAALLALKKFIRTLVDPAERDALDAALSTIRTTEGYLLMEVASWVALQVTGFPTPPPDDSSSRRPATPTGGTTSSVKPAGRSSSPGSRQGGRSL